MSLAYLRAYILVYYMFTYKNRDLYRLMYGGIRLITYPIQELGLEINSAHLEAYVLVYCTAKCRKNRIFVSFQGWIGLKMS